MTSASINVDAAADEVRYESDDDLVRRAVHDASAFGELFERYHTDILAFMRSRVRGNAELANDLSSQVFTRAYAALPRYTGGSFRAWLYAIARNSRDR